MRRGVVMEKRIVIFGATGGTGKELVKQALQKHYKVTAFVRNSKKTIVSDQNVERIQGDIFNYTDVHNAIDKQDTVLCALGASPSDKSKLRTNGTANIIKAMTAKGARRLLCISALGVGDSNNILPWYYKKIIIPFLLKNVYEDHEAQEIEISKSSLDWTIIRPSALTNAQKTENYEHGFLAPGKLKFKISRSDVAHFILNQIESDQYLLKKVSVSN
jgi:putative NADH-flavin reductase